mmetsp:Transcript_27707/g.45817  ORF Transcript_27707/g.45817 Transcript_27707/m.45817 type:complete len:297 (-) Transcript_27707:708-1598(-)
MMLAADRPRIAACNESICSLRSLVSGDNESLLGDDESHHNADNFSSPRRNKRLEDNSNPVITPFLDHAASSRSITTELAIIASTSPEIKALSAVDLPITPVFPHEINFDSYHVNTEGHQSIPLEVSLTPSLTSFEKEDDRESELQEKEEVECQEDDRLSSESPSPSDGDPQLHEVDELVLYMEQSLSSFAMDDCSQIVSNRKENLRPCDELDMEDSTTPCTNNKSSRFTFKRSSLRQRALGVKRPSFHRRVSFDNLPSPAEIASPELGCLTSIPRRASSFSGTDGPSPLAMNFPLE